MFQELYIANRQTDTAKFGGLFDNIIKAINTGVAGAQAGGNLWNQIQGLFGGGGSSAGAPARGLEAITQRTGEIIAGLRQLQASIGQIPYEQIYQSAQQLVSALSNPSVIYQAKKGKDAKVLADAKTQANQILQQIAASSGSVGGNVVNQAGQVITSGGGAITGGLDFLGNNPLIYVVGGGLIAYLLLRK